MLNFLLETVWFCGSWDSLCFRNLFVSHLRAILKFGAVRSSIGELDVKDYGMVVTDVRDNVWIRNYVNAASYQEMVKV